jgi:hypothetical protein
MFRKLDLFPSSGEGWETPTLLGLLGRANLNHWIVVLTWGRKQIQFLKRVLLFLEYQTMDKVQKPFNPECYTPSSETFTIYHFIL